MTRPVALATVLPGAVLAVLAVPAFAAAQQPAPAVTPDKVVAQYCVGCHSERNKPNAGNLALTSSIRGPLPRIRKSGRR